PAIITPSTISSSRRPTLQTIGSTLSVAFTYSQALDTDNTNQWAYYTRCSYSCMSPANWSDPLDASGQAVRVNANAPFDLVPEIAYQSGCVFIFFHGYVAAVSSNEVIWDVNSCDGWSGGARDQVTGFNMRGIYPQVVMSGDTVHLVYEWVDGTDHQIYYMQGTLPEGFGPGDVYLPLVSGS
ncbi:MAG TPA: hypothetical protein VE553_10605, partial [Candidatus Binatia bacterium]|nr:hypothetical protein [Candidatus Binatia bacterium]